jgi:signal transduction histidine kinase
MNFDREIDRELSLMNRSKTRYTYVSLGVFFFISFFIQGLHRPLDFLSLLSAGSFLLGMVFRFTSTEIFFLKRPRAFRVANIFGYFLMSLAWCLSLLEIVNRHGLSSSHTNTVMLFIGVIFILSAQTLTTSPDSFYSFLVPMGLAVASIYTFVGELDSAFLALGIIAFLIVNIHNFRLAHGQVCKLIRLQILSDLEQKKFQDLINSVPAMIVIVDKDLTYTSVNDRALAFFPGMPNHKVGALADNVYTQFVIDFIESDRIVDVREMTLAINGSTLHFLTNIHRTIDGGAIIVSISTDELVATRAKAEYSSKLASLGQMAAGIAHEVNNPLTIIQGSASIIKRLASEVPLDVEGIQDFADKLVITSKRISKTIQSLKALSRNGENDPLVAVSIGQIFLDCLNISNQKFKNLNISLSLPQLDHDILVKGREVQLGQVLLNLLNNACDAVESCPEPWVKIDVLEDAEFVFINVQDSGPGISPQVRGKLMEPFFTTKQVNKGTGLGLSISKTIMGDHQGELILLEDLRHTTFQMKIPKFSPKGAES